MDNPYEEQENLKQARGEYDERIDLGELELEEQAKQDVKLEDWLLDVYKRLEQKRVQDNKDRELQRIIRAAKEQNGFFFDALKRNGCL